jgi:hypothetical protein
MKKFNVKVLKAFLDKYTGLKHKAGDTFEVDEARYREINRKEKLVEATPVTKEDKKKG